MFVFVYRVVSPFGFLFPLLSFGNTLLKSKTTTSRQLEKAQVNHQMTDLMIVAFLLTHSLPLFILVPFTLAIFSIAINILAYVPNSRQRPGRTKTNQNWISYRIDCHWFIACPRMTIAIHLNCVGQREFSHDLKFIFFGRTNLL